MDFEKEIFRVGKEKLLSLKPSAIRVIMDSGNLIFFGLRERADSVEYDKATKEYVFYKKEK